LEDLGKVEMMPVLEGKRMTIMLTPLKAAAPKKEEKKGDRKDQKPAAEAAEAETEAGE
jgi:translation initiation factor IF-3